MTTASLQRSFKREALLSLAAMVALFAVCTLGAQAQVVVPGDKDKGKEEKPVVKAPVAPRANIETSGFTRPGNPDDTVTEDGTIKPVSFGDPKVQKFKVMGGTVYFAVFKNAGEKTGDTFGTGLADFDAKFQAGRSFRDSVSPRFDRKAKYLYLYQLINDRNLQQVAATNVKKGDGIVFQGFDEGKPKVELKGTVPVADDLATFALKILADPREITSWGHFRDAGFAANVTETNLAGAPITQVVDKQKVEKEIRLAASHLPEIESKLPEKRFRRRAPAVSLGELEKGFGVDKSDVNLQATKSYSELKQVLFNANKDDKNAISWVAHVENLIKGADKGREPEYVQLMYTGTGVEERIPTPIIPGGVVDGLDDDITRCIFRVDFERSRWVRQGERSVVFGFTSDLPPVTSPLRIDTPTGAAASSNLRLASYFSEEVTAVGEAPGTGTGIRTVSGLTEGTGMALAMGTALGQAPTPSGAAPPPAAAPGFAGLTGGFSSLGGGMPSGGGGGGFPALGGGQGGGRGGGVGSGGGLGGGQGNGQGDANSGARQAGAQQGQQVINFNATLVNQQNQEQQQSEQQQQFQGQKQNQNQNQNQKNRGNGHGHGHHHHGGHGHVVPAPASALLGLLGIPALWCLRRKKNDDVTTDVPASE